MIRDVLRNYINYPVAVTTETLFVDWETPFPAIAFCISTTRAIKTKYFKRCVTHVSRSEASQNDGGEWLELFGEKLASTGTEGRSKLAKFSQSIIYTLFYGKEFSFIGDNLKLN